MAFQFNSLSAAIFARRFSLASSAGDFFGNFCRDSTRDSSFLMSFRSFSGDALFGFTSSGFLSGCGATFARLGFKGGALEGNSLGGLAAPVLRVADRASASVAMTHSR
jgi:hypothetical protein